MKKYVSSGIVILLFFLGVFLVWDHYDSIERPRDGKTAEDVSEPLEVQAEPVDPGYDLAKRALEGAISSDPVLEVPALEIPDKTVPFGVSLRLRDTWKASPRDQEECIFASALPIRALLVVDGLDEGSDRLELRTRLDPAIWASGISVEMIRKEEPDKKASCSVRVEGFYRGIDIPPNKVESGQDWSIGLDSGVSVELSINPPEGFRSPGIYKLSGRLDPGKVFPDGTEWKPQGCIASILRIKSVETLQDRLLELRMAGSSAMAKQDYPSAEAFALESVKINPLSFEGHNLLSQIYFLQKNKPQALVYAKEALRILVSGVPIETEDPFGREEHVKNFERWVARIEKASK